MLEKLELLAKIPLFQLYRRFGWPKLLPINLTLSPSPRCNSKCQTCNIWQIYPMNLNAVRSLAESMEIETQGFYRRAAAEDLIRYEGKVHKYWGVGALAVLEGGRLAIVELQAEGRRPMTVRDFVGGHPINEGAVFSGS